MYVDDTCEALDLIMHDDTNKVVGEAINLGTGLDTDILTIAQKILNILDKPQSLIQYIDDRPGQVSRHISSTAKASRLLGWTAKTNLDDGLQRTVEFYKNNKQWWKKFLWMKELWGQR